ncbi:hypothetical protein ACFFMR_16390 [Micromonospora andamanensis]|uniref:Uncharacterized protein n=1 Tax=Micromonospora andamanensis TaxID=1287068 RepID=A0ABQ4I1R6_9ACTN|nr:hypothetical protein [Micromonospora andamanensis]GIJ11878.1 hypothetical protein Van01_50920 [Micromonospora andamanensis]
MNDDEVWDAVKQTLSDVQMDRPVEAIEQRGRARRRRRQSLGLAAGGGVAAVAALALALPMFTGSGTAPTGPDNQAGATFPASAGNTRLVSLAANLTADNASLPGDASLIIEKVDVRRGTVPSRTRYHLYTDSGEYYYTEARNELPRVIVRGENLGNGFHTRGVAAARYAATGDLTKAREQMINSVYDEGKPPTGADQDRTEILRQKGVASPSPLTDEDRENIAANHLWVTSVDVLSAGGGDPKVRAGVLRLISTIPDVTVVDSTTGGQPTLTLTASVFGDDTRHVLTINAQNGVPISSLMDDPETGTSFAGSFKVSRVTVADISAGEF